MGDLHKTITMINIKPVDKKRKQVEEQVFYNFMQLVQQYPQYTVVQHLSHFLREKGDGEDHYFWSNEKLLKKIEDYKDELDFEFSNPVEDEN